MNIKSFTVATLSTLLVGSSIFAQETQPPRTKDLVVRTTPVRSTSDSPTKDQTFALCLAIANHEQVLLSSFAKDRVTHADVKAFAVALEKAHQTSVEQLKAFSPPTAAIGATAEQARQADTKQADANRAEVAETSFKQVDDKALKVDFMQLQQEISAQCLKDSKEMLNSKKGADFDQCFVGLQIAKHASSHSTLTVLQRHSTGKLQEWIKSALEINDKHMEAAVTLMDKLAEAESTPATR